MKNTLIALSLLCLSLWSCEKILFTPPPKADPEALFEAFWMDFNHHYALFEERKVDWSTIYQQYRPLVKSTTSDDELFDIFSKMIAPLNDGHVGLTAPNRKGFNSNYRFHNRIDDTLFNLENIKKNYLEAGYKSLPDNGYVWGKLRGSNLGYLYLGYVGDNLFALHDFLAQNENADGIVIDLRHNGGGDFTYCFSEIGRLTQQPRFVFKSKTKNGTGLNDYTPWHEWHIQPKGTYFNKPMVVLFDRFTISAGERSAMALMSLPNVTTVGDTTCGAHSTLVGRELANGWSYTLATQKILMFDGKSYEGMGLPPQILYKNKLNEVNTGLDRTLEKAIDLL